MLLSIFTILTSLFVALIAVYFANCLNFLNAKKGIKREIIRNKKKSEQLRNTLEEQLELFEISNNRDMIPSFSTPRFHDSAFHYFSINGYFLKLDNELAEKLEDLQAYIDIFSQFITRQDTIIFSLRGTPSLFNNLQRNMSTLLLYIHDYEELYNDEEIQKFICL